MCNSMISSDREVYHIHNKLSKIMFKSEKSKQMQSDGNLLNLHNLYKPQNFAFVLLFLQRPHSHAYDEQLLCMTVWRENIIPDPESVQTAIKPHSGCLCTLKVS